MNRIFENILEIVRSHCDLPAEDIRAACENPQKMPKAIFLALQLANEAMDDVVDGSEGVSDGYFELNEEVCRIRDASPWTCHPTYGCVLASDVEKLNERDLYESN